MWKHNKFEILIGFNCSLFLTKDFKTDISSKIFWHFVVYCEILFVLAQCKVIWKKILVEDVLQQF